MKKKNGNNNALKCMIFSDSVILWCSDCNKIREGLISILIFIVWIEIDRVENRNWGWLLMLVNFGTFVVTDVVSSIHIVEKLTWKNTFFNLHFNEIISSTTFIYLIYKFANNSKIEMFY